METFAFIIILSGLIWFWHDSLRAREIAVSYARYYCQDMGFQLLDETVAMKKLKTGRDSSDNFVFQRYYYFEFSANGYDRYNGNTLLIGQKFKSIQLNHPDGIIIQEAQIN